MSSCRSCKAPILWCLSSRFNPIPINAEPRADGNLIIVEQEVGRLNATERAYVARAPELFDDPTAPRFVAHFVTCPNADQHRKGQ